MTFLLVSVDMTRFDEPFSASVVTALEVLLSGMGLTMGLMSNKCISIESSIQYLLMVCDITHGNGLIVAIWPIAHKWLESNHIILKFIL